MLVPCPLVTRPASNESSPAKIADRPKPATPARPGLPGPPPRVCKACQNARYLAKLSPQRLEHRKRRKALLAKRRRIELKIQKAQAELRSVEAALDDLGQNAQNGA